MFDNLALSLVLFFPILSALILFFIPSSLKETIKSYSLYISIINFLLAILIFIRFESIDDFQFVVKIPWNETLGITYSVGIDGISLFLLLITTFFTPIAILSTWNVIKEKEKTFYICMLFLQGFLIGSIISLDMFFFYIFWELMLIPVFFMIGVWGGSKRIGATVKFFIYTMAGSLTMLISLLYIYDRYYQQYGYYTFDITKLYNVSVPPEIATLLFFMFLLAFAIKAPLFPFHTWLPDAYTEAPTSTTLILSAVMAKIGVYGMIRFVIPLFPNTFSQYANLLMTLAVIGTIYAGLIAIVQKDMKRLVAYSSISHLGYILLGVFALNLQSLQGSLFHMMSHALSTGALFLLVGILEERIKTRMFENVGGLMKVIPYFGTIFMLVMFASIGLPGLNGFVGEFLILLGVFGENKIFSALCATGIIIGAIYMLWMFQRVMFGELKGEITKENDLNLRELSILIPISALIIIMGIYPQPFLSKIEPSISKYIEQVQDKQNQEETYNISSLNMKIFK